MLYNRRKTTLPLCWENEKKKGPSAISKQAESHRKGENQANVPGKGGARLMGKAEEKLRTPLSEISPAKKRGKDVKGGNLGDCQSISEKEEI